MINRLLDSLKIQQPRQTNGGEGTLGREANEGTYQERLLLSLLLSFHSPLSLTLLFFVLTSGPELYSPWFSIVETSGGNGGGVRLSEGLMHPNEKRHLYSDKAFPVSLRIYPPRRGRIPPRPDPTFPTRLFLHPPDTDTMAVPSLPLGCPAGCVNVPCRLRNATSSVAASCSAPLHNWLLCTGQQGVLFLCLFQPQTRSLH